MGLDLMLARPPSDNQEDAQVDGCEVSSCNADEATFDNYGAGSGIPSDVGVSVRSPDHLKGARSRANHAVETLLAPHTVPAFLLGSIVALATAPTVAVFILGAFTIVLGQHLSLSTLRLINGVYTSNQDACIDNPCIKTLSFLYRILDRAIDLLPIPARLDIRHRKDDICTHCVKERHARASSSTSPESSDADPALPDTPTGRHIDTSDMREMLQSMNTGLAAINEALFLNDYLTRETAEAARLHRLLMDEAKEFIAELRDVRDSVRETWDSGSMEYDTRSMPAILGAPGRTHLDSSGSSFWSTASMESLYDTSGSVHGSHGDSSVARNALTERRKEALIAGCAPLG
ncbi:hypothetical protein SeLEV6574_g05426 [Synchytrium endobioticum]|uniref:Uncharacterized protein n=1 Tax=Synchytrium endobioticum TaxID=286115 RepID=A0A507CUN8_9FUNG|nr:hypothetical protein SeLEV6574_g05426 [Synchytrium endobioticum]